MSSDNGIYILQTKDLNGEPEYRVKHLQAIENVDWDDKKKDHTNNDDIRIVNAREMFKDAPQFASEVLAFKHASAVYDEIMKDEYYPIVEYGISKIKIDRVFQKGAK